MSVKETGGDGVHVPTIRDDQDSLAEIQVNTPDVV